MGRRRSRVPQGQADSEGLDPQKAWALLIEYSLKLGEPANSRFQTNPHTFAPRIFISPGLWRIPEPEDYPEFSDYMEMRFHMERLHIMANQLREPFPSNPSRPPRFVIRAHRDSALSVQTFYAEYAAQAWLKLLSPSLDFKWLSSTKAHIPDIDVTISSPHLEELVEYEPTPRELDWEIPQPYPRFAAQIRGEEYKPPVNKLAEALSQAQSRPAPAPRAPRSTPGQYTPADVAASLNIPASAVRRALRKLNMPRPYQWADLETITKQVKGAL